MGILLLGFLLAASGSLCFSTAAPTFEFSTAFVSGKEV